MQNFSPERTTARLDRIEAALFGTDTPDYVAPPSDKDRFPPIQQDQAKNPDGSGRVDQYGRAVMVDRMVHQPGLIDKFEALHSKAHGTEPAGEGGATDVAAHLKHGSDQAGDHASKKSGK
jgi:hypothetical protein